MGNIAGLKAKQREDIITGIPIITIMTLLGETSVVFEGI